MRARCQAQLGSNGSAESGSAEGDAVQNQAQQGGAGSAGSGSARPGERHCRVGARSCSSGRWLGSLPQRERGPRAPQPRALRAVARSSRRAGVAGGVLRGHRLLRPQAPPPPPPPLSCLPARRSSNPRPRRAGLLVWLAEAERYLSQPRRPPTRDQRDSRERAPPGAAASSPLSRGRSGPLRRGCDSPPLPPEGEGAGKPCSCSRIPRAEAPAPEARDWKRGRRRRREGRVTPGRTVSPPGCGCRLHKSSSSG